MGAAAAAGGGDAARRECAGPVLFPCGEIRRDELPARLRHEGIEVEEVVCYRSVLAGEETRRAGAARAGRHPRGREPQRGRPPGARLSARRPRPRLLAVGPTTAAAAARARDGRPPPWPTRPTWRRWWPTVRIAARPSRLDANERSLPARLPARAGGAAAGVDDAPGRPLSPRVSRGARPRRLPDHGAHARAGGRGDAAAGGPPRRGCGHHLQRHPGRACQAMGMALTVEEGTGPRFHDPLGSPGDSASACATWTPERRPGLRARGAAPGTRAELARSRSADRLRRRAVDADELHGGRRGHRRPSPGRSASWWSSPSVRTRCSTGWPRTVGRFLEAQVAAGAQAVQLFDSWAAALGPRDFREFALPYLAEAVRSARNAGVPVIAFAPGAGWALEEIADRDRRRRDRCGLADRRGRGAAQARDHAGGAAGQPGSRLAVRPSLRDRAPHPRDAGRLRRCGPYRQPRPRHPARRPGRARSGLRAPRCRSGGPDE